MTTDDHEFCDFARIYIVDRPAPELFIVFFAEDGTKTIGESIHCYLGHIGHTVQADCTRV